MTLKVNPVTLASYSSPERAIPQPSAQRAVKLKNPWAAGPFILRTFFPAPLSEAMHSEHDLKERQRRTNHSESFPLWGRNPFTQPAALAAPLFYNLRRSRHHNPRPERPSNLRTLRTFGAKPRQPSRRRCVPWRQPRPCSTKKPGSISSAARFYYAQINFVCFTSSMVFVPASCMVMDSSLLKWSNTDFTPSAPPRLRP